MSQYNARICEKLNKFNGLIEDHIFILFSCDNGLNRLETRTQKSCEFIITTDYTFKKYFKGKVNKS